VIAQRLLVTGSFLEKGLALGRIALVVEPGEGQLRRGEALGECELARHRREQAFAVELHHVACVGFAEAVLHAEQRLAADEACEHEGQQAGKQQGQQ